MADMSQPTGICQGTTATGHPCLNFARPRSSYCYRHVTPLCERCEVNFATTTVLDDGDPVDLCDICATPAPRNDALHDLIDSGNRLWRKLT